MELAEYAGEGIDVVSILFKDNLPTLDLFLRKPIGLFVLLDEETKFPKGLALSPMTFSRT